jgi:hypothetical protein
MLLALSATVLSVLVLVFVLYMPALRGLLARYRNRPARPEQHDYDPGRERRAEQRARALLRSCVGEQDWEMYRDLGFLRVWGGLGAASAQSRPGPPYAYLIYPHKPIVAFLPQTGVLLNEYCVQFPDHTRPYGSTRLPDSDDVLAKWLALTGDEKSLIAQANMHLPGRQIDPEAVQRDLKRLARFERARIGAAERRTGNVHAS